MKKYLLIAISFLLVINIGQYNQNKALKESHKQEISRLAMEQMQKEKKHADDVLKLYAQYSKEIQRIEEEYSYDIEKINEEFNHFVDGDNANRLLIKTTDSYRCDLYSTTEGDDPKSSIPITHTRATYQLSEEAKLNLRRLARDADIDRANLNQCKRYIREINEYIDDYNLMNALE